MLLQGPFTEDLCSLLNAVNYIFKCLVFLRKINILFFLGFSRNAAFIYYSIPPTQVLNNNTLRVQNITTRWKTHCDKNEFEHKLTCFKLI